MSSTIESYYSASYTEKTTRRDQNGNLMRAYRDSSLPPPIRKSKLTSESPASVQPTPPPRKHVSISQSDLQGCAPDSNKVYRDYNQTIINKDRHLPLRSSYRPASRQSHLTPNLNRTAGHSDYDENLSYHYASQRANYNNPLSPGPNSNTTNYYYRNLHQGQTLPVKKSPYSNYAFHIPPNYNRFGSRSSSVSYDRFGHHALDRAYQAQTVQAIPDMVTTAERQQLDYERQTPRKIMLSEGNLLTAHVETIRDDGRDNPFKPGTELSWEADLIVRLYKKGHPLSQVPVLLEKIKKQLQDNKNTGDLDASLGDRLHLSSDEVINNYNGARIVNKSNTISNDLCNVSRGSNQPRIEKRFGSITTSSEKKNDAKKAINDEVIERIISKLDNQDTKAIGDNRNFENQENDNNVLRKERTQTKVLNKTKLPPAIVNMPMKTKKKEDYTKNKTNETKIKQSFPTLEPNNSKRVEKTKFKTKKGRSPKGKNNNSDEMEANSHHGNKVVDVKRRNCCSIQ